MINQFFRSALILSLYALCSCALPNKNVAFKSPFSDCKNDFENTDVNHFSLGKNVTLDVDKKYSVSDEDSLLFFQGWKLYSGIDAQESSDSNYVIRLFTFSIERNNSKFEFTDVKTYNVSDSTAGICKSENGIEFEWKRYYSANTEVLYFNTEVSPSNFLLVEIIFPKMKEEELCEYKSVINSIVISY
ncbi:MAG: hypothetical protein ACJAZ2_002011 [Glaciecola sp.]|jgi:hypothetical protein